MLRRFVLAAAVSLLAGASANAVPAQPAADPAKFIGNLGSELQTLVGTFSPIQRYARFDAWLNRGFDLRWIARFVLGRYWRAATPIERREFLKLFEDHVVRKYGDRLSTYGGSDVLRVTGSRADGSEAFVDTEVVRQDAARIPVEWRLVRSGGTFKITDIIVDGISMAATERVEFASEIERDGGLENLLAQLRYASESDALARRPDASSRP